MWRSFASSNFIHCQTMCWKESWRLMLRARRRSGFRKSPRIWARGLTCGFVMVRDCWGNIPSPMRGDRLRPVPPRVRTTVISRSSHNWWPKRLVKCRVRAEIKRKRNMPIELKVPSVGESITEVEIGDWLKHEGDFVEKDANVAMIESEKATVE